MQSRRIAYGHWRDNLGVTVIQECVTNPDLCDGWALALRLGKNAIITGPTAARLQGIPLDHRIVLAIMPADEHAHAPGARILRRPPFQATRIRGDLRMTGAVEALVDTLEVLPPREAESLLYHALQRDWMAPTDIEKARDSRRKRNQHTRALERLHALVFGGVQSHAERRMRALLRTNKLRGWKGNHRIHDPSGRTLAILDFAHPALRIALEVDGRAFHSDHLAFERDRARQNVIVVQEWIVLRFTWKQITQQPARVVATVRDAIRLRAATPLLREESFA